MKKYFLIVSLFFLPSALNSLNLNMGAHSQYITIGTFNSLSGTVFALDSGFVYRTSGEAVVVRMSCPVTQTLGDFTFYVYVTTKTGTPSNIVAYLYDEASGADDPDRPSSTVVLGTSTAVNFTSVTPPLWSTFTIANVSLTAGKVYWIAITNQTGTPESNHVSVMTRGYNHINSIRLGAFTTADGISTDPTVVTAGSEMPIVIKFSNGTLMCQPYVAQTNHASNSNDRGNRYVFPYDLTVVGIQSASLLPGVTTAAIKVYQGTSLLRTLSLGVTSSNRTSNLYFDDPLVFRAGVPYDVVLDLATNSTSGARFHEGTLPTQDVSSCLLPTVSYIDGVAAGSYTATAGSFTGIQLILDDIPNTTTTIYDSTIYDSTIY